MLTQIPEFALKHKWWVIIAVVFACLLGFYETSQLSIDAVPDITNVQVMINTKTGALDPEQIEKSVTHILEIELSSIPNLEEVRSISKYGLSQIIAVFKDGTDIYWARQQVNERIQNARAQIPISLNPRLAPITTGLGEVLMYVVQAKPGSALLQKTEVERLSYLRTIQDFVIKPQLKRISGVAEVDSNGGYKKEIHINIDPTKLEQFGITIEQLVSKLKTIGENYGGGYIQKNNQQIIVRTLGTIHKKEQLETIPIKLDLYGKPILLSSVAEIREEFDLRIGAATFNGSETVLGTILMMNGANSRQVALDSKEQIDQLDLPDDISLKVVYDRSFLVNTTIKTVAKNLTEGACLVVIILLIILGNFRAAILVSLAIPISMLWTSIGMRKLGISANLMSLGAIDFGLLVDASVVLIENIIRKTEERNRTHTTPFLASEKVSLIIEACKEVITPITFGLAIIMLVYGPILYLEGSAGKMFRPMAYTVLLALAGSLIIALFLMPVLAYFLLFPKRPNRLQAQHSEPLFFKVIRTAYFPLLQQSMNKRWLFTLPTLAVTCGALVLFFRMGSNFIPTLDEGDLVIGIARNTSSSITHSLDLQKKQEAMIAQYPNVEHIFSRLGSPDSDTDPMGVNLADTFVILNKNKITAAQKSKLFQDIEQKIKSIFEEQDLSPTQPIEMRFNEMLEGSRADITLRIFGPDLEVLMQLLEEAKKLVRGIQGTEAVELDALTALQKSPLLDIKLNTTAMAQFGISLEEANHALEAAMNGIVVGSLYEGQWKFPIMIHLDERLRDQIEMIKTIPVGLNDGGTVDLGKITTFTQTEKVTTIAHYWNKRYAALSVFLKDRDTQSFIHEMQTLLSQKLSLPKGYRLYYGGQFRNMEKTKVNLIFTLPILLAFILILLYQNFKSVKQTLLVALSIPFAMTGGVYSLFLSGIDFSLSATVGFIALAGIAILNGTVLVSFFNQLRTSGFSVLEAVQQGAVTRLRPVCMTALVAMLGFVPMAFNTGLGAEIQKPLATVVIGGLLSSTLLTLVLLPTLYNWLEGE